MTADATPPAPPRFAVGQWVRYKRHFSPLFGRITETVACADGWMHLAECEVDGRVMCMWITDCDRVEVRADVDSPPPDDDTLVNVYVTVHPLVFVRKAVTRRMTRGALASLPTLAPEFSPFDADDYPDD